MGGVTLHRADVEPILQFGQQRRIGVDDGDVVGFARQVLRQGRPDLAGPQEYYLHAAGNLRWPSHPRK
jgi:hypothetical protein